MAKTKSVHFQFIFAVLCSLNFLQWLCIPLTNRKNITSIIIIHHIYKKWSAQKVSRHALWKIETFIEEDTRYKKHCMWNNDTAVPFKEAPMIHLLEETWFIASGLNQVISNCSLMFLLLFWQSHRTNSAMKHFMPRSRVKISDTVVLQSPDQLLVLTLSVIALCWLQAMYVQHSQVFCLLQDFQNVDQLQQILDPHWSICATLLFALHSLHHPWKPSEASE